MKRRFSKAAGLRTVRFFEELLVHTKGAYARQPFILSPFQKDDIVLPLFGSQMYDPELELWVRQYTLAWLEVARKNGKSELLAGCALYLTGGDDEEGAEVYGAARDKDQAAIVFNVAARMLELSGLGGPPRSGKPFSIYPTNKRIVYGKTGSFYRVIAADALGNLGQDPHAILFDEVIAQPNAELWDALKTGFGSRRQPIMIAATTAGDAQSDFARQEHEFSERVLKDPTLDPRRFVYMRNLPEDADWQDESLWELPNPALDDFLRRQVLRDELQSALGNPREERRFRMFRLNQWQSGSTVGWAGASHWRDEGNNGMVVESKLKGKPCWLGVVAKTYEASIALLFRSPDGKDGVWARWMHFIPEELIEDLERRTSGAAAQWRKKGGSLVVTDGGETDLDAILKAIESALDAYDVREIAAGSNNLLGISQPLVAKRGVEVFSIGPNTGGASVGDWERMLSRGEFNHGGDPYVAWQVAHAQVKTGASDVVRFDVAAASEPQSAVVAAEHALRRLLIAPPPRKSAYANRGLMTA